MRSNDVENLLAHVEKSLVNIKSTYDQSLYEKTIPPFLPIDIKNVMENLRSSLDYAAKDIATIVCKMTQLCKKNYSHMEKTNKIRLFDRENFAKLK